MRGISVLNFARPFARFIERKAFHLIAFLDRFYTPLAVVVLAILGSAVIFITTYLSRYSRWNYWMWRSRALTKAVYFVALLIIIKFTLGVIK